MLCKAAKLIGEAFIWSAVMCAHLIRLFSMAPTERLQLDLLRESEQEAPISAAPPVLSVCFVLVLFFFIEVGITQSQSV